MRRNLLVLFTLGCAALAGARTASAQKGQPDPPAPTWNDPTPPGVETVQPITPTWCAGHKPRPWLPASIAYDELEKMGYSEKLLQEIGQLACDRPDDLARQKWIAFYRQGWLNIVGTTEKEDREAMAARMQLAAQEKALEKVCKPLLRTPKDAPPDERSLNWLRAQAIGCAGLPKEIDYNAAGGGTYTMASATYWIDRAVEPPDELVRLAFVLRCLNPGASSIDPATAHRALGSWSMCGHDAKKLDRRAFDKAVASLGLPALGSARAREMFTYTRKLLKSYDAGFKALVTKDEDYKRLLDEPAVGFAAWVKTHATSQASFDAALEMEVKYREGERRDVVGCSESLRKQLVDHVSGQRPKSPDDVADAANDDVGQPILRALVACDSMTKSFGLTDHDLKLLGRGRVRRGPRTAAFWHTLDVVSEIAADRERFPVQPGNFGGPLPGIDREIDWTVLAWESTFNQTSFDRDQKGRVAAVKAQGDGVMVTFKTESWKEPTFNCKETNRIDRITADGRVEYRQSCTRTGTETVKVTPRPVWIRKDLAAGIKPGVFMKYRIDNKPKPAQGFPMEVYADEAQKKLVQYWGFPVKP